MEVLVGAKGEGLCGLYHCSVFGFVFPHAGHEPRFGHLDFKDDVKAFAILVLPHRADLRPEAAFLRTFLSLDISDVVDLMGRQDFGGSVFHTCIC